MRDFLHLLVIVVMALLIHAVADKCEKNRIALERAQQEIAQMNKLLNQDLKIDHFVRQLKHQKSIAEN